MIDDLEEEARLATEMLTGKLVRRVWRNRSNEVGIEFTDGSRLFIDVGEDGLELSISGVSDRLDDPPL